MLYQLKPYLDVRRSGSTLRIGNMPPRGVEIEDAPEALDELVRILSRPASLETILDQMMDKYDLDEESLTAAFKDLLQAEVVGEPISAEGRYSRHGLYFDLVGANPADAQARLAAATVGVVGTGGIGSNVATLLAAAGVGRIVLTDGDTIEASNLTRQVLYDETTIGQLKVDAAKARLGLINSDVSIHTVAHAASQSLLTRELADCDVVVVSADSPDELHEWVDAASRECGFAYLVAGYIESYGTVGPLTLPGLTACYTCIREDETSLDQYDESAGGESKNLNAGLQAASWGPLNFIVASMAANEALRLLAGLPCATAGTRLLIDSERYELTSEAFQRNTNCVECGQVEGGSQFAQATTTSTIESVYADSRGTDSLNALLLDDFLRDLTGDVQGLSVLDYGCGSGDEAVALAQAGASVDAYDPSGEMRSQVQGKLDTLGGGISLRLLDSPARSGASYDLIVCTNVLDLVAPADIAQLLSFFRARLDIGGRLVITVPHPFKDGARWEPSSIGTGRREIILGDYFDEGPQRKHWETSSGEVALSSLLSHHRTTSTYVNLAARAGFTVANLHEPAPSEMLREDYPDVWEKTSAIPYFLTLDLRPTTSTAE